MSVEGSGEIKFTTSRWGGVCGLGLDPVCVEVLAAIASGTSFSSTKLRIASFTRSGIDTSVSNPLQFASSHLNVS